VHLFFNQLFCLVLRTQWHTHHLLILNWSTYTKHLSNLANWLAQYKHNLCVCNETNIYTGHRNGTFVLCKINVSILVTFFQVWITTHLYINHTDTLDTDHSSSGQLFTRLNSLVSYFITFFKLSFMIKLQCYMLRSYFIFITIFLMCTTGECLKPEQFLKAEHLLKHAFPYRDRSFYGPDGKRQLIYQ